MTESDLKISAIRQDAGVYATSAEGRRAVTLGALKAFAIDTAAHVKAAFTLRDARLERLEARVAELEQRPVGLKYAGVWQSGQRYALHTAVTHRGSLWACRAQHAETEPGEDAIAWQLVAKRGRDGRDAR